MQPVGPWRMLSALVVTVAVAGCGTTVTPSPSASGGPSTPSPSAIPSLAPATTAWVPAGTLALARASTHAVVLADGRVLVVGTDNICTPGGAWDESVEAELLDPATGLWVSTGSLNAPRTDFFAVTLPDGRVLVAGGLTSAEPAEGVFGAYSSTKLYDPATARWSAAGLLGVARTEPAGALLTDGTVLVAGGTYVDTAGTRVLASAEVFDPETGTWSRTGDLRTARTGARAVTLADGRVLLIGGDSLDGLGTVPSPEIYDPATGTWSVAGSLATPRAGFSLVALPDGGALVAGGTAIAQGAVEGVIARVERLDPTTVRWSPAASMQTAATNRAAVVLGDGRVLVAGGVTRVSTSDDPGTGPAIAATELYDPATDSWSAAPSLPGGREGGTFVTLADQTVLLLGGDSGYVGEPRAPWCPDPVAEAVRYVPENLASFPAPRPPAATLAKSSVPRAAAKPADAKKAAASVNAFGLALYRQMLGDGTLTSKQNAVFSPTSIALALAMARAGAKGETASEMDTVLHTTGWAALGTGLNSLEQALSSRDATWKDAEEAGGAAHELKLRIANAAFAQRGWEIVQGYLDAVAGAFGAGLRLLDYKADPEAARKNINAWVQAKTMGRIPKLIPDPPPEIITKSTRLVLVNAIYLKANWELEFRGDTKPRTFTRLDGSTAKVPTMSLTGEDVVPYASGAGWKATELRYRGGGGTTPLAMTLILPDNLGAFEMHLSPGKLSAIVSKLDAQRTRLTEVTHRPGNEDGDCGTYAYQVRLFMPQFGIDTYAALKGPLAELGMPLAFDGDRADFSGIHDPANDGDRIAIGEVIHQANIDVDEKGTEAAAATAVVMATGGCTGPDPAKTVTLRLDRPFLFLLRDVETGAILFMGRVVDPSAKE
jgi:serpin B